MHNISKSAYSDTGLYKRLHCSSLLKRLNSVKAKGQYPYFKLAQGPSGARVNYDGREVLSLCSNDYLGIANDPKTKDSVIRAVSKYGAGYGGSPLACGYTELHRELERRLASFLEQQACMLFPSGYQANLGTVSALVQRGDIIAMDRYCHASAVDGALLSGAEISRFDHNHERQLETILSSKTRNNFLVIVDGIYGMQGDYARLDIITPITQKYRASIIVDYAHGIGVIGPVGKGTVAQYGCSHVVDVITGSMSKSLGTTGGFAAGSEDIVEYLRHRARAAVFSAAVAPANVAAALTALDIIEREPQRREKVIAMGQRATDNLRSLGLDVLGVGLPVLGIRLTSNETALRAASELFDRGVLLTPVISPAVRIGMEMLRMHVTACHSMEDIDWACKVIADVVRNI